MEQEKKSPYILSSLDNALKVLDILSVKDNISLAEFTRISKLDKTSLFKILYTLERRDYVVKTPDAKYRLGVKFVNYGSLVSERQSLAEVAAPFMRRLRDRCRESVYLGVLNANGRVIVMHLEPGTAADSISTRIGFELDAHSSGMGKVLLAYLDPVMRESLAGSIHYKLYTPETLSGREALLPVLDEVRTQGSGDDVNERYPGHSSLAVPVFDRSTHCVAALSIVCKTEQYEARRTQLLGELLDTAQDISHKLGY